MHELVVIAEGETEQSFVRDQLAGHLALHGITAWAVLPGKNRKRGGVKKWEVARQDIIRTLKERRFCTTMMDFYAMPDDWPGRSFSKTLGWQDRANHVEAEISKDIVAAMGSNFHHKFFIPYVQLHEFEALAFANVEILASVIQPIAKWSVAKLTATFGEILAEAGDAEAINDSYETCPSRRISRVVPAYQKRIYGPIVTRRIGLDILRQKCSHFDHWLKRLESIAK